MNLVVGEAELELLNTLSELPCTDGAVVVGVEVRKRLLQVEVLDEESRGDLVKSLIKSHCSQIESFEARTELVQVDLADAPRVSNTAQNSLVLHRQRKIKCLDSLLEVSECDYILWRQWVVQLAQAIVEGDLSRAEDVCDLADELRLALPLLGRDLVFETLPLLLALAVCKLSTHALDVSLSKQQLLLFLVGQDVLGAQEVDHVGLGFDEVVPLNEVVADVDSVPADPSFALEVAVLGLFERRLFLLGDRGCAASLLLATGVLVLLERVELGLSSPHAATL